MLIRVEMGAIQSYAIIGTNVIIPTIGTLVLNNPDLLAVFIYIMD